MSVTLFPPDDARNAIVMQNDRIDIDENQLDLFARPSSRITPYMPKHQIPPYEKIYKVAVDIETLGLDPAKDRIIAIGLLDSNGKTELIADKNEEKLLQRAISLLHCFRSGWLFGYNNLSFDLPFIAQRAKRYGLKVPYRRGAPRTMATAQMFGKSSSFTELLWNSMDIIDLFHQVLAWDNAARTLSAYDLKTAAVEMKLRSERRLELTHQEILEAWRRGDIDRIITYLKHDLEDTMALGNYLVPALYYQRLFVPKLSTQALSYSGNGKKWQLIVESEYGEVPRPTAEPKQRFEGGLTLANPGLYHYVAKIDVSSLYPSIMLRYHVCSHKDVEKKMLGVLAYLTNERLRLKQIAKGGNGIADQMQGALKILINSSYGFLGVGGCGYNDMRAAALVTAYGRSILRLMLLVLQEAGGQIVEADTDGIIFHHPQPEDAAALVSCALPDGIGIELEWVADGCYIPQDEKGMGLRKNYLVFDRGKCIIRKGIFRKRDRSVLEREFPVEILLRYLESPELAHEFYQQTQHDIKSGTYPCSALSIRRKIRTGEKQMLRLGNANEIAIFYEQENGMRGNTLPYNRYFYLHLIESMYDSIIKTVCWKKADDRSIPETLQLSLFS